MNNYFPIDPSQGGGEERFLGGAWEPLTSSPSHLSQVFGDVGKAKLIRQEDWQPTTLQAFCPPIKNQNGIGACCAFDTVTNIEIARAWAGLPYVELSPGDLYRVVSGGTDRGSLPEDNLRRCMEVGVLTAATCSPLEWRRNMGQDSERAKYRILEAYWCPTFAHAASALQQGFSINANVWWYGNDPIDASGWHKNAGSGGRGGHSVCGMALVNRNGLWGIKIQNSWGKQFGVEGYSILPAARCEEGCQVFQWWACRGVVQEDSGFPAPIGS